MGLKPLSPKERTNADHIVPSHIIVLDRVVIILDHLPVWSREARSIITTEDR
jgi:hypothetical protein